MWTSLISRQEAGRNLQGVNAVRPMNTEANWFVHPKSESEAAAGCEVLPTVVRQCVETPGRIQAPHLAAASCRKTVPPGHFRVKPTLRNPYAPSDFLHPKCLGGSHRGLHPPTLSF